MAHESPLRREDAHAVVVAVCHDHVAVHVRADAAWERQLALTRALGAELAEEATGAGEDLHAVVVGVGHDDLVVLADGHVQRVVELVVLGAAGPDPLWRDNGDSDIDIIVDCISVNHKLPAFLFLFNNFIDLFILIFY